MATRNAAATVAPAPQVSMPPPPPPPSATQVPVAQVATPPPPPPAMAPPLPPVAQVEPTPVAEAASLTAPMMPPPPPSPGLPPQTQEQIATQPAPQVAQFQPPAMPAGPTAFPEPASASPLPSLLPGLNIGNVVSGQANSAMGDIDFSQFDLTGVSTGFKVLPDNLMYEWEIKSVEVTNSKSGNRMMKLVLESTFPEEYEGVKVWDYVVITPDTMWKLMSLAEACGYLSEDRKRITAPSAQAFVGHVVRAGVSIEEYNGRNSNKIKGAYEEAFETSGLVTSAPAIG